MPRNRNCCFCFDARSGATIIAVLGFVMSATTLIGGIAEYECRSLDQVLGSQNAGALEYARIVNIGSSVLEVILYSVLFYGLYKENHTLIMPWLIIKMINLILMTIALVFLCVAVSAAFDLNFGGSFTIAFVTGTIPCIGFYFWNVVRSVFLDFKEAASQYQSRQMKNTV